MTPLGVLAVTEQHPVEWTDEKLGRVWDFHSGNVDDLYFSRAAGSHVLGSLARLRGARIVDCGCGKGFRFEHLARSGAGVRYVGLDFSAASVERCRERFAGTPGFEAAVHATSLPSSVPESSTDLVVGVEVIEHLDDARLAPAIAEMRRVLRPGGLLMLATPNEERLADLTMRCRDCGCVFHRWRHVRSWSAATLLACMRGRGFDGSRVLTTDFAAWYHRLQRAVARRLRGGRSMSLVYLGVKAGGGDHA